MQSEITKSKNAEYHTPYINFPVLYVTFLDENHYYIGVQTKSNSPYHPFVILRNINYDAWGIAANREYIIPEIDCFDNRIIKFEKLISSFDDSVLDNCFNNSKTTNLNRWFIKRIVLKEMSTVDEVWASEDMPIELTKEYCNPCLPVIQNLIS